MNQYIEDCPMEQEIPVNSTGTSVLNDKEVVEVQCTPTSVVTAGSTTRMLWLKIKAAFEGISTSISGLATTLSSVAKKGDLPTDYAKQGSDNTATNTAISAQVEQLREQFIEDNPYAKESTMNTVSAAVGETKTAALSAKESADRVLFSLHRDGNNLPTSIVVNGKIYDYSGVETISNILCEKWMCVVYEKMGVAYTYYTKSDPVVGGKVYYLDEGTLLEDDYTIESVISNPISRKSDIPTASAIRTEMEKSGGRLLMTETQVGKNGETIASGKTSLHAKADNITDKLSDVASRKNLQEVICPNAHNNAIKVAGVWYVTTGVACGGLIIYNNVDVNGDEVFLGASADPAVGNKAYPATKDSIDFSGTQVTIDAVDCISLKNLKEGVAGVDSKLGTFATGKTAASELASIATDAATAAGKVIPTDYAKQGTDSTVSLTQISQECGKIGTPKSGAEYTTLFGAIEANQGGGGGASVDDIVNGILSRVSVPINYNGYEFSTGHNQESMLAVIANRQYITRILDTGVVVIGEGNYLLQGITSLVSIELPNALRILCNSAFRDSTAKEIILPKLYELNNSSSSAWFYGCTKLQHLKIPKLKSIQYPNTIFVSCINLIDLEIGEGMTSNFSLVSWSPTNALKESESTLVTTEGIENNLQQLLYNIREHIAKKLNPSITATITFSAAVKAAIQADTATMAAFPASWTIA